MWKTFTDAFYLNFCVRQPVEISDRGSENNVDYYLFACLMGIVLGFLVGMIRSTYEKTHKLKVLNAICKVYLTVIRGTPVVVQLLIIYFVVFGSVRVDKVIVAILAFGVNSGAYVAEIFRSGIMSIDPGQMEAGRSLGFNYAQTMWYIIMPQAFKTVLPNPVQRVYLPVKGDLGIRLHCHPGSDQGRGHHPKQDIQCIYAPDCGGHYLSYHCNDIYKADTDTGKEAETE